MKLETTLTSIPYQQLKCTCSTTATNASLELEGMGGGRLGHQDKKKMAVRFLAWKNVLGLKGTKRLAKLKTLETQAKKMSNWSQNT